MIFALKAVWAAAFFSLPPSLFKARWVQVEEEKERRKEGGDESRTSERGRSFRVHTADAIVKREERGRGGKLFFLSRLGRDCKYLLHLQGPQQLMRRS